MCYNNGNKEVRGEDSCSVVIHDEELHSIYGD
jgi:hypothetical protein